jgi:2',3'-cyclic-nucleotide 2'-phosphodiesterase/3'-nucleotidase
MKRKFHLTVFHTSDTHGHLTSDSYSHLPPMPKGLSRVSSFLKTQKQQHQIKIDLGDTIQGSPLAFMYKNHQKNEKNPFSQLLNHMKYDYFIPGNHDFNYGLQYLNEFLDQTHAKVLCSNVYDGDKLYFRSAYDIKIFEDNLRVAIIGITNNYIPNWETKKTIGDLIFEQADISARNIIESIKQKEHPDYIIVAYHGGYECNIDTGLNEAKNPTENLGCKIFKSIPDVDLLLTGHEHRHLILNEKNRVMLQPGYAGECVSQTDIIFNNENGKWTVDTVDAKLVYMKDYQDDPEAIDLIKDFIDDANHKLDQVIGFTEQPFKLENPLNDRLNNHIMFQYINAVQKDVTNAMISCCGLGNDVTGFSQNITIRDVLNTYVYPNTLSLCEISGKTLKSALLHNAQFFYINDHQEIDINPKYLYPKKELYNYDIFSGVSYEYHIYKAKDNEVKHIKVNDVPIKDSDTFTFVINSYRLSGGGNITWHEDLKVIKHFPLDITEVLIDSISKSHQVSIFDENNIKIIKHL